MAARSTPQGDPILDVRDLRTQFFTDAGISWTSTDRPSFAGGDRHLVRSVGGALRVNLLGIFILEVAASRPFDRVDRKMQWQVGLRQGF